MDPRCTFLSSRLITIMLATLFCTSGARGEGLLSWQACRLKAMQQNPALAGGQQQLDALQQNVVQVQAGYYPTLELTTQVSHSRDDGLIVPDHDNRSLEAGARIELFSGFRTQALEHEAQARLTAGRADYDDRLSGLLQKLRGSYLDAMFSQAGIKLSQTIVDRMVNNSGQLELRYRSGQEARWVYQKSLADLEEARWQLSRAQTDHRNAMAALAAMLAEPAVLQQSVEIDLTLPPAPPQAELQKALAQHPQILGETARVNAAKAAIEKERAGHWPTIAAFSNYSKSAVDSSPLKDRWSVGLQMNLPLFSGFATSAAIQGARASARAQEYTLADTEAQTRAALEGALADYQSAATRVKVLTMTLAATRQQVLVVNQEYSSGLRSYFEWDQAQSALTSAERATLGAQKEALVAHAYLQRLMNRM